MKSFKLKALELGAMEVYKVNQKRIKRLMKLMNWKTIYMKPNTSKPGKAHKIYPYLLKGLKINQVNQVWSMDITYIPMHNGFIYLCYY